MKNTLVIMSDNRDVNQNYDSCDYNTLTAVINHNYCIMNGYDFKYLRPHIDGDFSLYNCQSLKNKLRHSSWSKLLSTIYCIDNFNDYDYVLYIDSDCIFNNVDILIENHFTNLNILNDKKIEDFSVLFLNDKPWHPKHPCAGFFILKNNQKSKQIFKTWYSGDYPNFDTKHCWEQIALYPLFDTEYNESLIVVDDVMFVDENPTQFLRHIGSHDKNNRIPFFKTKVEKLNLKNKFGEFTNNVKLNMIEYNTSELIELIYGK